MARPTDYAPEVAERFCGAIAQGSSVVKACEPTDMPADRTIYRWLAKHEEFRQLYARAREIRADFRAEEIIEISDDATPETVQVAKLQIDTRRWLMGKEAGKYGERTEITGAGGKDLIPDKSPMQVAREIAFLLARAKHETEGE